MNLDTASEALENLLTSPRQIGLFEPQGEELLDIERHGNVTMFLYDASAIALMDRTAPAEQVRSEIDSAAGPLRHYRGNPLSPYSIIPILVGDRIRTNAPLKLSTLEKALIAVREEKGMEHAPIYTLTGDTSPHIYAMQFAAKESGQGGRRAPWNAYEVRRISTVNSPFVANIPGERIGQMIHGAGFSGFPRGIGPYTRHES